MSFKPDPAEAERVARITGLPWPPRDASAISRRPRAEAAAHARSPLGLGIVNDEERDLWADDLDHGPVVDIAHLSREAADSPADVKLVYLALNSAAGLLDAYRAKAEKQFDEMSAAIAEREARLNEMDVRIARLEGAASERARASGIIRP
jgi:hypothetical protein